MTNRKNKFFFIDRIKKNLIIGFSARAGVNCFGRKTIFTQSGGMRLFNTVVDFKRTVTDICMLLQIEKNVNYTSLLGLICYANGFFGYILLSDYMKQLRALYTGFSFSLLKGPTFLNNIPAGNFIHHVEFKPTMGAKMMRAAGTSCFVISKEGDYSFLKMGSGWLLKVSNFCIGIIGKMSNENHFITNLRKAGARRRLGFRPTVRGVAKNPCDHAHGGGEGTGSPPRAHKTPKGNLTKSPTKNKVFEKRKRFLFKIFKK